MRDGGREGGNGVEGREGEIRRRSSCRGKRSARGVDDEDRQTPALRVSAEKQLHTRESSHFLLYLSAASLPRAFLALEITGLHSLTDEIRSHDLQHRRPPPQPCKQTPTPTQTNFSHDSILRPVLPNNPYHSHPNNSSDTFSCVGLDQPNKLSIPVSNVPSPVQPLPIVCKIPSQSNICPSPAVPLTPAIPPAIWLGEAPAINCPLPLRECACGSGEAGAAGGAGGL